MRFCPDSKIKNKDLYFLKPLLYFREIRYKLPTLFTFKKGFMAVVLPGQP